jgi:hypothetical protein
MEISKAGGLIVPGVPGPVPSLFPDSGKCFQRVSHVLRSRRSRLLAQFSVFPFRTLGTMGTQ